MKQVGKGEAWSVRQENPEDVLAGKGLEAPHVELSGIKQELPAKRLVTPTCDLNPTSDIFNL